jgi:hypothetical protein
MDNNEERSDVPAPTTDETTRFVDPRPLPCLCEIGEPSLCPVHLAHVTGDGDALCKECENRHETAQEISDHWIDRWNGGEGSGRGAVEGASSEAYAAGIARGRELGARDENVACEKIATEEMCGSKRTTSERLTGQRIVVPPITGSGGK